MYALLSLLCTPLQWLHRAGQRRLLRARIRQLQQLLAQRALDKHPDSLGRHLYEVRLAALRRELQALEQQR